MLNNSIDKRKNGFTMIELLVVLAVIGIFFVVSIVGFQASRRKSNDSKRKADLARIKLSLEDYYNDNNCYPPAGSLTTCGSSALQPYLHKIPCDPQVDQPYLYTPLADQCAGYRLHAALENDEDPGILKVGCSVEAGCGIDIEHNYGVASGTTVNSP